MSHILVMPCFLRSWHLSKASFCLQFRKNTSIFQRFAWILRISSEVSSVWADINTRSALASPKDFQDNSARQPRLYTHCAPVIRICTKFQICSFSFRYSSQACLCQQAEPSVSWAFLMYREWRKFVAWDGAWSLWGVTPHSRRECSLRRRRGLQR